MTPASFLVLLLIAGVCGALGQSLAGYSHGGCLASIVLGLIGALLGNWLASQLGFGEIFAIRVGSQSFPIVSSVIGAALFVSRVGVSVSLAVLLVVTTPWADVLKSLRALKVPQVFVLVLSMTYRYIFLFLHTANGILLARKSRVVGRTSGSEQRRWITGTMGNLMSRAFKMSNDVYAAMLARGFGGEIRTFNTYRTRSSDWAALAGVAAVSVAAVLAGRILP